MSSFNCTECGKPCIDIELGGYITGCEHHPADIVGSGYIVQFWPGCYFAPWTGDPGRTLVLKSAKIYETADKARLAIERAKKMFPRRSYYQCEIIAVGDARSKS